MAALPLQTHIDQSSSFTKEYRKRELRLGDGFSQRVKDGINATVWKGNLTFSNLTTAEYQTLISFIDGIGSWGTFDYQPIGAPSSYKFSVDATGVSITALSGDLYNVSFSCRQEFDF